MTGHATWSTRLSFLLAAVGAAVGLGNIWKFPYMTGTNGGAAFVTVYLICVVAIAIPTSLISASSLSLIAFVSAVLASKSAIFLVYSSISA